MSGRISFLSISLTVGLLVNGGHSHASDLDQCESAAAAEQQRYEACDRIQRSASSSPRDRARALFRLGQLEQKKQDGLLKAVEIWDAAVAADPSYEPAVVARAEWFVFENRGHDAIKILLPVLATKPDNADLLVMIGRAYASVNLPDRALRSFNEALQSDPKHLRALFESGQVYEMAFDYARAADAYERAGEIYDPSFVSVGGTGIEHPYLAAARSYERLGEISKALALTSRFIDRSPAGTVQPHTYESRASYYDALGLANEAVSDLTSALRRALPEERIPLLFKRAILYQRIGKSREAEEDFDGALRGGDRRTILRMQVYLRNHGFAEVKIDGVADPAMLKFISACLATPKCGDGLGRPI